MTHVFLDTVGMIALWDDSDQWHEAARAAYRQMLANGRIPTTTTQVLCECGNAAARRTYRTDVVELRVMLIQERLVIEPTPEEIDEAWVAYRNGSPGDAGIVDRVSFVVMRRLGIEEVFSNDRHFKVAGFITLF